MSSANIAQAAARAGRVVATTAHPALIIRDATPDDMAAVQRIYAEHVLHGTATFEEVPPSVDEMRERRARTLEAGMPYLVAVLNDEVVGYCYATQYRPRVAYRYTIEDSIYLAENQAGKGLGKPLLAALIERCEQGPWRQMIAVIAGNNNFSSIGLHRSMGFTHAGTQVATGFKFNEWIDVVFMQRALGAGKNSLPDR
ncbi:GNAT family N-acetyltransferase [Pollutimonas nitritireducens]|uniref:GNAT family N-acetyltransferase n=1 Tax=Pollutimonas nitritireducens TaxID=2045209 RepID=A0A2N4UCF2_9BURK|nr:GNAT family N-acetyltransferase [Pollutimonas nitritireducens]PLC52673.1 GNAT family N-acetyltransferase [Pollutimonas nitritireducens]